MSIHVRHVTDPACPVSWAAQPGLRRIQAEFGEQVRITYIMGGLAREFSDPVGELRKWLDAGAASGMPVDGRIWLDAPPKSSYPAALAVKAAAEQQRDEQLLRLTREGFAVGTRRLDSADALIALAGDVPGMNVERFRIDLQSNAIVEALGADLDSARKAPWPRFEVFPAGGGDVPSATVEGDASAATLRSAVLAAGGTAGSPPEVEDALRLFPNMATPEVAEVCDLRGPRAPAELWRLALEWRARHDGFFWFAD